MPLVDVTYGADVSEEDLVRLSQVLPDIVSAAAACPEEPWTGPPQLGDIEIRFRQRGPHDVGQLAVVVEVRTKLFASRLADKHARAEQVRAGLATALPDLGPVGVWLILSEGAWSQTPEE